MTTGHPVASAAPRTTNPVGQIVKNTGWLAGGEALTRLAGFAIALYLARVLGAASFGSLGIAIAVVTLLDSFVQGGTSPAGTREVARAADRASRIYHRVAAFRLAIALTAFLLLAALLPLLSPGLSVAPELLILYALALIPAALRADWVFRGLERMGVTAAGSVAERGLILLGLLACVRHADSPLGLVPIVEVGAAGLIAIGYYTLLRRSHPSAGVRFDVRSWGGIAREGVPLGSSALLRMFYVHGDVLLLGLLTNAVSAGEFLVSHKLVLTLALAGTVVYQSALPSTSRLIHTGRNEAIRLQTSLIRWLLLLLVPAVVLGAAEAEWTITWLFGSAYEGAAGVLVWLLLTVPVFIYAQGLRQLLVAAQEPGRLFAATALGTAVHLSLALLLIPRWSAVGAAQACLAGQVALVVALAVTVRRALGAVPWERAILAAPFGGCVALAPLLWGDAWNFGARLGLAGASYILTSTLLGALRREEIAALVDVLGPDRSRLRAACPRADLLGAPHPQVPERDDQRQEVLLPRDL